MFPSKAAISQYATEAAGRRGPATDAEFCVLNADGQAYALATPGDVQEYLASDGTEVRSKRGHELGIVWTEGENRVGGSLTIEELHDLIGR